MKTQQNTVFNGAVFRGPNSVRDFLSPERMSQSVELHEICNPYEDDGVEIHVMPFLNPNIKILPAFMMLQDAYDNGQLKGVHTITAATSGNLASAIFTAMQYYDIERFVPVVPNDLAGGKLQLIQTFTGDFVSTKGTIAAAKELGKQPGWLNINQYTNEANIRAHRQWTGPHIYEQSKGRVRIVFLGLGSCGTIGGVSQFLREKLGRSNVTIVGVMCSPSAMIPGLRNEERLKEIGFSWRVYGDAFESVETQMSYAMSRYMIIQGLTLGPSSGAVLQGINQFLAREKSHGKLDKYRSKEDGKIVCVFIGADSSYLYLDKYPTILHDWQLDTSFKNATAGI